MNEGWGVAVLAIHDGEEDDSIADIHILVVRITADVIRIIGGTACVPTEGPRFQMWFPVDNFRAELDDVDDASIDLRDRWFATEEQARQHATDVASEWGHPNPWQVFAVLV